MGTVLAAGDNLLHYRLVQELGSGGMGVVWKAVDTRLEREVALKLLFPEHLSSLSRRDRFMREARCASALNHPNIIGIYEINWDADRLFIVMEYVRGRSLFQILRRGRLQLTEAVIYGTQICDALGAAHAAGVVHRDLKPANVMVTDDGLVKVLDFGLAKLMQPDTSDSRLSEMATVTAPGLTMGTLGYMSPEQALGGQLDERSDVFSFGIVLYEMLTGVLPFPGQDHFEVGRRLIREDPLPVSAFAPVPPELEAVVNRCLRKEREQRYRDCAEASLDLRQVGSRLSNPASSAGYALRTALSGSGPVSKRSADRASQMDAAVRSGSRRKRLAAGVPAVLAVALTASWWIGWPRLWPARPQPQPSIAVLPFANLSAQPENEYLADGIAEELNNDLTKLQGLRVVARSSTLRFKGAADLANAARQLHVGMVLTGGVRRAGDQIRVSAALVRAEDGVQVWSEIYQRDLKDTFALEDQISRAVADALRVKLAAANAPVTRTGNAQAYDLYLQAQFYAGRSSPASLGKAIAYYRQALDLDPNLARAYAGLSSAYANLSVIDVAKPELAARAKEAATRALALDASLAQAHTALGFVRQSFDFDWAGAESEFQRAIALNSMDAEARYYYAGLLMNLLRTREARAQLAVAQSLDPLSPRVPQFITLLLLIEGRNAEAEAEVRKLLATAPELVNGYTLLGLVLMREGRYEEALPSLRRAVEISNSLYVKARLGWACGVAGHTAEARQILEELRRLRDRNVASPVQLASVYGGLGRIEEGFQALEQAAGNHDPGLNQLQIAPNFDPFKKDPRFGSLLARMGMQRR